ncbi:MAG: adenosylcobinamide amidohydrolase [Clostridia bacterium]|jgi:adenosylcobinamide amidohydrolase|nr:adenosylcobinamide amidohydrolase [Clostridia bacterium]
MREWQLPGGERAQIGEKALVVRFPGPRRVLSSARLNGGYREDLDAVFNCHISGHEEIEEVAGGRVADYLRMVAQRAGVAPERTAGLLTAARMENAALQVMEYRELAVTAIVTAGVDVNGGRAGDPAGYYEVDEEWTSVGTVNTLLFIRGNLPPHALVRAVVTASEAKAAALQELMAPSRYSCGVATGSGTDQIAVVADPTSPRTFTDAGQHSKLGELIGRAVIAATKEALEKETGLGPARQLDLLARLDRYRVGPEVFWQQAREMGWSEGKETYLSRLRELARDPMLVALAAAVLHLLDEAAWGLLPSEVAVVEARRFVGRLLCGEARPGEEAGDTLPSVLDYLVSGVNGLLVGKAPGS